MIISYLHDEAELCRNWLGISMYFFLLAYDVFTAVMLFTRLDTWFLTSYMLAWSTTSGSLSALFYFELALMWWAHTLNGSPQWLRFKPRLSRCWAYSALPHCTCALLQFQVTPLLLVYFLCICRLQSTVQGYSKQCPWGLPDPGTWRSQCEPQKTRI